MNSSVVNKPSFVTRLVEVGCSGTLTENLHFSYRSLSNNGDSLLFATRKVYGFVIFKIFLLSVVSITNLMAFVMFSFQIQHRHLSLCILRAIPSVRMLTKLPVSNSRSYAHLFNIHHIINEVRLFSTFATFSLVVQKNIYRGSRILTCCNCFAW